ncbi:MAG: hypothetical protein LC800_18290 [Acidobacteria bacterium]|nr:hypothetical protein [Acidobacteriota bacterium]
MRVLFSKRIFPLAALLLALAFAAAAAQPAAAPQPGAGDALAGSHGAASDEGPPILVRHLPEWETAQGRAVYALDLPALRQAVPGQPVLEVVPFDGGTEAATADYGAAGRLVIVEFLTPQIAFDADAAIKRRIDELRGAGAGVPSVYRRVGNYSVFVFGANDAAAAERLAGQVQYEKTVRWLGDDPHRFEKHNRYWIDLSASVIVNTVKATGIAIVACLGVGGLLGAVIFRRRRAQAALTESYSDAGGMMRLNLDDHASELLGRVEK